MHHPWRAFRALAAWDLIWAHLPHPLMGVTDFDALTVTMDRGLLQAERRCTIAHEVEHIHRGPVPAEPVLAAREEAAVDQAVARKLIDIRDLGEALAWAHDLSEAADELWVDEPTLRTRLQHLHPSERAYLRRRLENHDDDTGHEGHSGCCDSPGVGCAGCPQQAECADAGTADAATD